MSLSPALLCWMRENPDVAKKGKERVLVIVDDRARSLSNTLLRRISKESYTERGIAAKDHVMENDDHFSRDETVGSSNQQSLPIDVYCRVLTFAKCRSITRVYLHTIIVRSITRVCRHAVIVR